MAHECFDVEVKDNVAHLVLKRADQLNTMIPAFWYELPEIVNDLSRVGEARALVIAQAWTSPSSPVAGASEAAETAPPRSGACGPTCATA
jgi:hypothetical protein